MALSELIRFKDFVDVRSAFKAVGELEGVCGLSSVDNRVHFTLGRITYHAKISEFGLEITPPLNREVSHGLTSRIQAHLDSRPPVQAFVIQGEKAPDEGIWKQIRSYLLRQGVEGFKLEILGPAFLVTLSRKDDCIFPPALKDFLKNGLTQFGQVTEAQNYVLQFAKPLDNKIILAIAEHLREQGVSLSTFFQRDDSTMVIMCLLWNPGIFPEDVFAQLESKYGKNPQGAANEKSTECVVASSPVPLPFASAVPFVTRFVICFDFPVPDISSLLSALKASHIPASPSLHNMNMVEISGVSILLAANGYSAVLSGDSKNFEMVERALKEGMGRLRAEELARTIAPASQIGKKKPSEVDTCIGTRSGVRVHDFRKMRSGGAPLAGPPPRRRTY